jgi:hypothetical protein
MRDRRKVARPGFRCTGELSFASEGGESCKGESEKQRQKER